MLASRSGKIEAISIKQTVLSTANLLTYTQYVSILKDHYQVIALSQLARENSRHVSCLASQQI
jgi:hypothetical protein